MALTEKQIVDMDNIVLDNSKVKEMDKSLGNNYIGERPGIDNDKLRKYADMAVTGAEIAIPVVAGALSSPVTTPLGALGVGEAISPFSTALGEFVKSKYIQGESTKQAVGEAALGGTLDVATMGAFKAVKPIAKLVGKTGIGKGMESGLSKVLKNDLVKYTKPIKTSIDDIVSKANKSIKNQKQALGQYVGSFKSKAVGTLSKEPLDNAIKELLLSKQIILEEGSDKTLKGLLERKEYNNIIKLINKLPKEFTLKQAFDTLENIDDALRPVYDKNIAGLKPSTAQISAEQIRGIFSNQIKELANQSGDKSIANYAEFLDILNAEKGEIGRALTKHNDVYRLFNTAVTEGKKETFENLTKLNNLLPDEGKFLDDVLNKLSRKSLERLTELYPSKPGLIEKGIELLPRGAAKLYRGIDSIPQTGLARNAINAVSQSSKIGLIDLLSGN